MISVVVLTWDRQRLLAECLDSLRAAGAPDRAEVVVGSRDGFEVRVLRERPRLLDYLRDINSCGLVVCGDTLALHVSLALAKKTVGLFLCTSPAEIYGYGLLRKVVHPYLSSHFYETRPVPDFAEGLTPARVAAEVRAAASR